MPKKTMNAFAFFMMELREQMKARGQDLPTMAKMPSVASPAWNRLTPDQKAPYEEKVREYRRQRSGLADDLLVDSGKFTADGISIAQMRKEQVAEHETVRAKESAIRSLVSLARTQEDISQTSFFIMSFNILVGTLEGEFLPNELGVVEYSIDRGIKNEYHTFINPGPIPVGYLGVAKSFSEEFHNIPISEFKQGTVDYNAVYRQVKRVLELFNNSETRYVFCKEGEIEQNQHCLDWLRGVSGLSGDADEIVFADLALLLDEMRSYVKQPFPFLTSVTEALASSAYDYSPNSRCAFHEDLDNKYCALGYCKRLAYLLSDSLCKPFNVTPTRKHLPERLEAAKSVAWKPKGPIRPVVNIVNVPVKPVIPHISTTIEKNAKSQFVKTAWSSITPSATLDSTPTVENRLVLDDEEMFPSLTGQMGGMSLASTRKADNLGSWANVSKNNLLSDVVSQSPRPPGIGRGAGLGRGWGNPN